MAKRRDLRNIRFWVLTLLVLGIVFGVLRLWLPTKIAAAAAGDVTLTGSPFSDPDAEDTHQASQWQVRDGAGPVYDSGTDAVNLTTITISNTFFTQCTTYFWKVRYQDNHSFWSDWSSEQSFDYTCPGTPTPTPTPTASPTTSPTPTASSTPPPTTTCETGDWFYSNGAWRCTDVSLQYVQVLSPNGGELFGTCSTMPITYYWDAGNNTSLNLGKKSCSATEGERVDISGFNSSGLRHDLYISTDGGEKYFRIKKGFDFSSNAVWHKVDKTSSHGYCCSESPGQCEDGKWVIASTYNFVIPPNLIQTTGSSTQSRQGPRRSILVINPSGEVVEIPTTPSFAAVHLLSTDASGFSSYDWGESVIAGAIGSGFERVYEAYDSSDNNFAMYSDPNTCPLPTPEPTATFSPIIVPIGELVSITVISPKTGDNWKIGSTYQTLWVTMQPNPPRISRVNVSLSIDGGRTFSEPLSLSSENTGVLDVKALERYKTRRAVIKVDGFDNDGKYVVSGESGEFQIGENNMLCIGSVCIIPIPIIPPPISQILPIIAEIILLLGSIAAVFLPSLLALIAASPILTRTLEAVISNNLAPFYVTFVNFISRPFTYFYAVRKRPNYGIVYDSITKQPIPGAVVRVYTASDNKLRETQYTNRAGGFAILVPAGKYTLTASKFGFKFPTSIVKTKTDGQYEDVYFGEEISIEKKGSADKSPIKVNIPIDQTKSTLWDLTFVSFVRGLQRFLYIIRIPLMILGVFLTAYLCFKTQKWYYWVILAAYVFMWIIEIKTRFSPRTYGSVKDNNGRPLGLVMIRATDASGKIKATVITGDDGKFVINLNPGSYKFLASRVGYANGTSDTIKVSKLADLGKINLKLKKIGHQRR